MWYFIYESRFTGLQKIPQSNSVTPNNFSVFDMNNHELQCLHYR